MWYRTRQGAVALVVEMLDTVGNERPMTQLRPTAKPDLLATLLPLDRKLAELKALLVELQTRAAFFELVRTLSIASPDGRAWNIGKLQESLDRLRQKKILGANHAIEPDWIEPLTLDLLARPDGVALVRTLRQALPKSPRDVRRHPWDFPPPLLDDVDFARSLRLAALLKDEAEVERLAALAEIADADMGSDRHSLPVLLAACPADPGFVDSLPPRLRDRVAAAHIGMLLDFGHVDESGSALIATARRNGWGPGLPLLDRALLRLDIMAERFESAQERIERVRLDDPVAAMSAEAALAFLGGRNDEALELFRAALKLRRKRVGKRKLALADEAGLLHVLALFANGSTALHAEIEALLPAIESGEGPGSPCVPVLTALLEFVAGENGKFRAECHVGAKSLNPLATAVIVLALGLIDGALAEQRVAYSAASIQRWRGELPLPLRILAEVHARSPRDAIGWTNQLIRLGPATRLRFLDIVPARDPWERSLDRIEGLLGAGRPDTAKADPRARAKRLAFLLDPVTMEITPQEQTAKPGGWSSGRAVSLKRLHSRDPKLDYLTPADLSVTATIRLESGYYYDQTVFGFDPYKAPLQLVGHPLVFDARAPERRVELVRYPAELIVREAGAGIMITLSHFSAQPAVFIEEETLTRWRVVELPKALVELGEVLTARGLVVPKSGRDRIVELIKTENPRLPIRSELAGIEGDAMAGDPTPVLQIAPAEEGLAIGAVVRPSGAEGPICPPGTGARSVLVTRGGLHRRVNRDLAAEAASLDSVIEACPALAPWRAGDQNWLIAGFVAGLEALQELQACPVPVKIEWPEGTAIRTTRTAGVKSVSLAITSARDWFEISGKIAVDEDMVIDMADLLARLGQARGRFVPLDDGRFLALTEDLKRRLEGFAAVTEEAKDGRRIGAAGALAVEELVSAAGKVDAAKRWKDLLARIDAANRVEPRLPAGFEAELRDYQLDGFIWLSRLCQLGLGACLADDMGLGKTVQSIALLLAEAPKGPSLVIAPTSVCHNWELESARFAPGLRIHLLAAAKDRAGLVESLGPGDVLVASYGLLHHESALLASRNWVVAIFDEAQNLKNAETRRAQASKQIEAGFRLALSGTPVENRLDELWSLFDTVAPGLLGSRDGFQRRFAAPIERGRSASARNALKLLLRPFLLRRTKAAVLAELPSRTEIVIEVEPGEEERAFYEAVRRKALASLENLSGDGGQKRIHILAEIMRLRRAACHPSLVDERSTIESAKLGALMELVQELRANRHRALVFSQFTGHLDRVAAALDRAGVEALRLDGSTPAAERARLVASFQSGEGELFLLSLKAGGTGLNLTGADYVVHLDPWWNPAVEDQATDRAHRIGQTRPVTVYRLVSKGSIEEKILALHATKRDLAADFLDGAEAAARLGEDELMALIRG
jgi:superfamily II DNA or RNA helicase